MSKTARHLGVATALAGTALALPLTATPASALDLNTEVVVYTADTGDDGSYGVYRRAGGEVKTLVAESDTLDVSDLSASPDGSLIATVEYTYSAAGVRSRLVVRDVSGHQVRVLEDLDASGSVGHFLPVFSPDGGSVLWTRFDFSAAVPLSLRRAAVAEGAATAVPQSSGLVGTGYLDATTLLAAKPDSTGSAEFVTLPATGGATTPVTGLPAAAGPPVLSPDGTRLAWPLDTSPDDASSMTSDLHVGALTLTDGVATVGAPTQLATGQYNVSPAWSRDGATVRFVKYDGEVGPGDVWSVPADGSAPATGTTTAGIDEVAIATGAVDASAPGAAVAVPFTLAGTAATIRWSLPPDTDLAGMDITRTASGTAAKSVYVAAPATSYADKGLVLGKTYTYAISSVDRSGNPGPTVQRQLTAVKAAAVFADPTSTSTGKAPFRVTFSPAKSFTVDYASNGGGYRSWVAERGGLTRTFGAASSGAAATRSTPGYSYAFRVTAFDAHGNATVPTAVGTAVVPYDQTQAAFSGGVVANRSDAWLGSVRTLTAAGNFARITVAGNRFQVIGERCTTCGVFDVYDNNRRIASVDTRGNRTAREVLYTRNLSAGNHTFVIKARGTSGRPSVVLDGFAVRK